MVKQKATQRNKPLLKFRRTIKKAGGYNPFEPPTLPPRAYAKNNPFFNLQSPKKTELSSIYEKVSSPFRGQISDEPIYVPLKPKTVKQDVKQRTSQQRALDFMKDLHDTINLMKKRNVDRFHGAFISELNKAITYINEHISDEDAELNYTIDYYEKTLALGFRKLTKTLLDKEQYYDRTKYCKGSLPHCDQQFCKVKGGIFSKKRCIPQ